jgi:hypothetical protein
MAYDNTNSGALFTNHRKQTEKHPDYTGKLNVNGVEFWLSGWVREKRDGSGERYVRIQVNPVEGAPNARPAQPRQARPAPLPHEAPPARRAPQPAPSAQPPAAKDDYDTEVPF